MQYAADNEKEVRTFLMATKSSTSTANTATDQFDATSLDAYWRDTHQSTPYYDSSYTYDRDYAPAYKYGYESQQKYAGRSYKDVEKDLAASWEKARGNSRLTWDKARFAAVDAWNHLDRPIPDDRDRMRTKGGI
jgi:hypothetical protein